MRATAADDKGGDRPRKTIGNQTGNGRLQQQYNCRHQQQRAATDQRGGQRRKRELFGNLRTQQLQFGLQQSYDVLHRVVLAPRAAMDCQVSLVGPAWQAFLAANDIGIAGVEFIVDEVGHTFTYDINTNTNYNPDAEAKDGRSGMHAIAAHLGSLLTERYCPTSHPASAA